LISTKNLRRISSAAVFGAAVLVACSAEAAAQSAYRTANTNSTVFPRRTGLATIDFMQLRVGGVWAKEFTPDCMVADCSSGGLGIAVYGSGFARADARSVFSEVSFVPGFDVGGRLTYAKDAGNNRYFGAYAGGGFSFQRLKLFDFNEAAQTITNSETNQTTGLVSAGLNLALGDGTVIGVGGEARRERNSAGPRRPVEICAPASIQGETGVLTTTVCERRVQAPLDDLTAGVVRGDVIIRLIPLGTHRNKPVLSLLLASSVDMWEGYKTQTNFALGPVVVPARFSGHIFAALTAEVVDAFNSNGESPGFGDKFGVRATVSVPLPVFSPTVQ
jgi:hypothetical protein